MKIPCLHLELLNPRIHLGPPTLLYRLGSLLPRLHHGPSSNWLRWAPLSLRLRLGQATPFPSWDSWPPIVHLPSICSGLSGSIRLHLPSGSATVLVHSGSTMAFWIPASASVPRTLYSTSAIQTYGVTLALSPRLRLDLHNGQLCHRRSLAPPPRPPPPPTCNSSLDHLSGCGPCQATPAPGSPLAPPTLHSPMDCFACLSLVLYQPFPAPHPPPELPPSSVGLLRHDMVVSSVSLSAPVSFWIKDYLYYIILHRVHRS